MVFDVCLCDMRNIVHGLAYSIGPGQISHMCEAVYGRRYFNLAYGEVLFQRKSIDIFVISQQEKTCGYTLEAPRRGASNEYPQHRSRNVKKYTFVSSDVCTQRSVRPVCAFALFNHDLNLGAFWIAKDAQFLLWEYEDSDQIARMRRLI